MTARAPNGETLNKSQGETGDAAENVTEDDYGSKRAEFPTRSASSFTEVWLPNDDDADLDVNAYDYDDEPGIVELGVNLTNAHVALTLTPEEASALADDLYAAAGRARNVE